MMETLRATGASAGAAATVEDEKKTEEITIESTANGDDQASLSSLTQSSKVLERDFDVDPTELYLTLQRKQWSSTISRAQEAQDEARTWISRKEKDGKLRWRLLPIHAAVIFKAPENVVEALLAAYPMGAQAKDDQGMLPLHLAFRNGSTEGVVNLLLVAYPQSIDVKDRKGRIPLVLAQASTSPNRDAFMKALERGPTYYAVAAAATERAAVTAEQRAIFDAKLIEMRNNHQHEVATMRIEAETKQQELEKTIRMLEAELAKTQETSQVLVDHVNSLEAQLSSRSDTERFLATKIANLDSSLKGAVKEKEHLERSLKTDVVQLRGEKVAAEKRMDELKAEYESTKAALDKSKGAVESQVREWELKLKKQEEQIKVLQVDWANSQANSAILEAQLKKKMETEHALATQVSTLASRLAESAAESGNATNAYASRVRALEQERKILRDTVNELSKKLLKVAECLDDMTKQQHGVLRQAALHEQRLEETTKAHAKLLAEAQRQEKLMENAKQERLRIADMLRRQEDQVEESSEERKAIMEAVVAQSEQMETSKVERESLVSNVTNLADEMKDILDSVLGALPTESSDNEDEFVDEVLKRVQSSTAKPRRAGKSMNDATKSSSSPVKPSLPPKTNGVKVLSSPKTQDLELTVAVTKSFVPETAKSATSKQPIYSPNPTPAPDGGASPTSPPKGATSGRSMLPSAPALTMGMSSDMALPSRKAPSVVSLALPAPHLFKYRDEALEGTIALQAAVDVVVADAPSNEGEIQHDDACGAPAEATTIEETKAKGKAGQHARTSGKPAGDATARKVTEDKSGVRSENELSKPGSPTISNIEAPQSSSKEMAEMATAKPGTANDEMKGKASCAVVGQSDLVMSTSPVQDHVFQKELRDAAESTKAYEGLLGEPNSSVSNSLSMQVQSKASRTTDTLQNKSRDHLHNRATLSASNSNNSASAASVSMAHPAPVTSRSFDSAPSRSSIDRIKTNPTDEVLVTDLDIANVGVGDETKASEAETGLANSLVPQDSLKTRPAFFESTDRIEAARSM